MTMKLMFQNYIRSKRNNVCQGHEGDRSLQIIGILEYTGICLKKKNGTNIYLQETIIRTRRDITKQQIRIRKLIKYYKCPDLGKQCKWVPRKTKLSIEARSPHSKVECTNCQVRENAAEEIWLLVKNQIIVGLV